MGAHYEQRVWLERLDAGAWENLCGDENHEGEKGVVDEA